MQDPALDNLVHAPGTVTVELGTLGAVVERGSGPIDMVCVSGFGLGASVFERFAERNAARYRMFLVTLAGCEGTAPPPMPAVGTSYGAQTWTNGAVAGVVKLLQERKLARPVLVGHFVNGTQVAARVAAEHPELVRALVLLAGTTRFEPIEAVAWWPRGLTLEQKVKMVDEGLAPRWFKTVTPKTWVAGNFTAADYSSVDAERGRRFAERANEPALSVLIRYLCEFHASDLAPALDGLALPLLIVSPGFDEALRADSKRNYVFGYCDEPWRGHLEGRANAERLVLPGAGILVHDDKPAEVDAALADFLARRAQ
jgi:pimeloyl-ACP methyl ester carboxylesterase